MLVTKRQPDATLAAGDVVTLQDRTDLMTVETVRVETFGFVLDCIWFDGDDSLCYRRFPVTNVDSFPRIDAREVISVGTEVRLRSRGPVMTVHALSQRDGTRFAECIWTGPMGRERRRLFPLETLVLTLMERFEGHAGQEI